MVLSKTHHTFKNGRNIQERLVTNYKQNLTNINSLINKNKKKKLKNKN